MKKKILEPLDFAQNMIVLRQAPNQTIYIWQGDIFAKTQPDNIFNSELAVVFQDNEFW